MSRPGRLDQRVTIERFTTANDGFGGQVETWATLKTVWAMVKPASGSELERFERLDAQANYVFTVRNRRDVTYTEKDRIVWQDVPYNIRMIRDPGDRAKYLEIDAQRGVAQ